MKKFTAVLLSLLIILAMAPGILGCAHKDDGKIKVVCTIFPQYDWVREIIGNKADNVDLSLILNSRADLHSYQPTVDDIVKISSCDLFIYVGGGSDKWVADALKEASNPDMIVINLMNVIGEAAKAEAIIDGMEEDHDDDQGDEIEYDEHVWLSLINAKFFCPVIADALSLMDGDNAEKYQNNLYAYMEKLSALDAEYQAAVDAAPVKTLLFGDRFPFRYLVDDYNLDYFAAFPGCSAETEASFETVIFLANKVDELNLKSVMVTESSDKSIAKTIISNTANKNQQILVLDAMQSVTTNDVKNGTTYLSIMESNLNVLKEALV